MPLHFDVIEDSRLSDEQAVALQMLFDADYQDEFGPWHRTRPSGYAPAETRVLALDRDTIVGHVGIQPRRIHVGDRDVLVGGTGGVLIVRRHRGRGIGQRLLGVARATMRDSLAVEFGYLGCREVVVPFYESAGWRRIRATERCLSPRDGTVAFTSTGPLMVSSAARSRATWPTGGIDLRGRPS